MKSPLRLFWVNLLEYKKQLTTSCILVSSTSVASYWTASVMSKIINEYATVNVVQIVLVLLFLVIYQQLASFFVRRYGESFVIKYKDTARVHVLSDLLRYPEHDSNIPELIEETNEVLALPFYLAGKMIYGFPNQITGVFLALFVVSSIGFKALAFNLIALVVFGVIAWMFGRVYTELSKIYSQKSVVFETALKRHFLSLDFLARNKIDVSLRNGVALSDKWAIYDKIKNVHSNRWLVQLVSFNLAYLLTLFYFLNEVQSGSRPIGDLVLVQWYYGVLLSAFIFIVETITDLVKTYASSYDAHERLQHRLSVVRDTSFCPTVEHGNALLITGENGSGKTTLVRKLLREWGGTSSSYFVSDVYPVHEELSSGELQKMMVARAANTIADLYVFDEPCSNTSDTTWFEDILYTLKGKTVIVVSHQPINYSFDTKYEVLK